MTYLLIALAGSWVAYLLAAGIRSAQRRRAYQMAVGLTLEEVCALLPAGLPAHRFTRIAVGLVTASEIAVAVVYEVDHPFRGNPPNVGMVFDRRSGALLRVCPEGIGLGLK